MSFVNASLTGSSFASGNTIVANLDYNIIQLNGECIVDKLRIVDYAMTTTELDALSITDVYSWDEHTLFYAEFTNNLHGGSIVVPTTIDSWTVVRFCCNSNVPEVIAKELDGATTSIVDYTAVKPRDYYYKVYPITATAVIAEIQSNIVELCYDYYAFLDPTTGESFTFGCNINESGIQVVDSVTTYEGFTRYPVEAHGQLNYETSTFSALLGNVTYNIYTGDTVAMYDALRAFINNGNEKIMKDRKGNIRRVSTKGLNRNIDEKPSEMPTSISFTWTETGAV
jgi:hypothetical protein